MIIVPQSNDSVSIAYFVIDKITGGRSHILNALLQVK